MPKLLSAFTLIELIVVMAVISILATLSIGNFQNVRMKARDAQRKSDLSTIAKSVTAYSNDHQQFPEDSNGKIVSGTTTIEYGTAFLDANGTIYAATLPRDPSDTATYRYESDGVSFTLYARLENTKDTDIISLPGITCGTGIECNYRIKSPNQI